MRARIPTRASIRFIGCTVGTDLGHPVPTSLAKKTIGICTLPSDRTLNKLPHTKQATAHQATGYRTPGKLPHTTQDAAH